MEITSSSASLTGYRLSSVTLDLSVTLRRGLPTQLKPDCAKVSSNSSKSGVSIKIDRPASLWLLGLENMTETMAETMAAESMVPG